MSKIELSAQMGRATIGEAASTSPKSVNRSASIISAFVVICTFIGVPVALAQTPAADSQSKVAPAAVQLLKQMSAYIGSANEFTFRAEVTFEHVLPSGQKLQYAATEEVALQRPGHVYVQWTGDLGDRQFWYDGKSVTLYDPATPFYASGQAPPQIDAMLDKVDRDLGFSPPLADFLYSDPYRAVEDNVLFGLDLGATEMNGRTCRSLAFVAKDVDWQIWIDTGPQLTPCKIVINYKMQPGQPQFSAVFAEWNFSPRIAEPIFIPDVPQGVEKVPFAPVLASTNTK